MKFFNKTEKGVSLDINDEIGFWGVSHQEVKSQLELSPNSDIQLNISSLGGDVNHAFAIYNMLKSHNGRVVANIYGDAASAATLIALGADEVRMAENVFFMIHNVWTVAVGDSGEMRKTADLMDKFNDNIKDVYRKKTGLRKSEITKLMDEETWFTAKEAKEKGFVDTVTESNAILNRAETVIYNSLNKEVAEKLITKINNNHKINQKMEIDNEKVASGIFASLKEMFAKDGKNVTDEQLQSKADEASLAIKNQFETALTNAEKELTETKNALAEKETALNAKAEEMEALNAEIAKLKASTSTVEPSEPVSEPSEKVELEFCNTLKNLVKKAKNLN